LAAATMTRPEGVLWGTAMGLDQLRRGRSGRWAWLAAAAAVFGPYYLWRLRYYGYPLPNTFYAKVGGGTAALGGGLDYLVSFLGPGAGALLGGLAAVGIARDRDRRLMWTSLLVLITGYVVWVGGDVFRLHRFFVPLLPVLTALATLGAASLWLSLGSRRAAAALGAVGATMVVLYARQLAQARQLSSASTRLCVVAKGVAGYLARHTAPDDSIAAMGVGALAFYGDRPVIDMLGITDEHIAHRSVPMGTGLRGHEKYDAAYVLSRSPAFIVLPSREALMAFVGWASGADFARSF